MQPYKQFSVDNSHETNETFTFGQIMLCNFDQYANYADKTFFADEMFQICESLDIGEYMFYQLTEIKRIS